MPILIALIVETFGSVAVVIEATVAVVTKRPRLVGSSDLKWRLSDFLSC